MDEQLGRILALALITIVPVLFASVVKALWARLVLWIVYKKDRIPVEVLIEEAHERDTIGSFAYLALTLLAILGIVFLLIGKYATIGMLESLGVGLIMFPFLLGAAFFLTHVFSGTSGTSAEEQAKRPVEKILGKIDLISKRLEEENKDDSILGPFRRCWRAEYIADLLAIKTDTLPIEVKQLIEDYKSKTDIKNIIEADRVFIESHSLVTKSLRYRIKDAENKSQGRGTKLFTGNKGKITCSSCGESQPKDNDKCQKCGVILVECTTYKSTKESP